MSEGTPRAEQIWDERYLAADRLWSGRPNPQLVTEAAGMPPGEALDVGCGEGADAIWLAGRGWRVTGVDVSGVALERAARHAADGDGVTWLRVDLTAWTPPARHFDLVNVQFLQAPQPERGDTLIAVAAAVRPGGVLLVVGHSPRDLELGLRRPRPELLFTADEVSAAVTAEPGWKVLVCESRPRQASHPDGGTVTVHDEVVSLLRLDP